MKHFDSPVRKEEICIRGKPWRETALKAKIQPPKRGKAQ